MSHGSVYPKASGAYNGYDRSDNIVLANSWDASSITHSVALINQTINILCRN